MESMKSLFWFSNRVCKPTIKGRVGAKGVLGGGCTEVTLAVIIMHCYACICCVASIFCTRTKTASTVFLNELLVNSGRGGGRQDRGGGYSNGSGYGKSGTTGVGTLSIHRLWSPIKLGVIIGFLSVCPLKVFSPNRIKFEGLKG